MQIQIAARYAPLVDSGFPIWGMKTVEEVRRERLAQLRQEAGSLVALNEKLGFNSRDATLSQILNEAKNSRTGTPKQMGSKLARNLERVFDKPVGWMDTDPALIDADLSPAVAEVALAISSLPDKQRAWALDTMREVLDVAKKMGSATEDALAQSSSVPDAHQAQIPAKRRRAS